MFPYFLELKFVFGLMFRVKGNFSDFQIVSIFSVILGVVLGIVFIAVFFY